MNEYRVQEYLNEMGVFHRHAIHTVPEVIYYNTNFGISPSLIRRFVILPPENPYADGFPESIRSWDEMQKLVEKAHYEQMRREKEAENDAQ
jgi:hypothetical protein